MKVVFGSVGGALLKPTPRQAEEKGLSNRGSPGNAKFYSVEILRMKAGREREDGIPTHSPGVLPQGS